ncbi:MAG: P22 phage major capsid protein family protein [Desulfovibrionaceae bacterium]|nr:P22 phage major capsid protein family protein [Desulfovibrionaceae bacterium]
MANTLTGLIPTLYAALDTVSREAIGMIGAVSVNAAPTGAAKGETITIPVAPAASVVDVTPAVTAPDNGDQTIGKVDMSITKSRMVPVRWNGEEQLGVGNSGQYNVILAQQFSQAMRALANEMEADLAALYVSACRVYGTASTTPFASGIGDSAQMRKLLLDAGAPMTDLQMVIDSAAGANLRTLGQLTKANEAGSDDPLRRGVLLDVNGFKIRESGQIKSHTAGSFTGTALVNNTSGYAAGATSIAFDGATSAALKAGDVLTFGSAADKYVVNKDVATTPLTIAAPGLVASVEDNAAITVGEGYTANLAFDRNAIQLIARVPAMPQGGDTADDVMTVTDPVSGLSFQVAVYRQYRQVKYEIGMAWGVKCVKSEHLAILMG